MYLKCYYLIEACHDLQETQCIVEMLNTFESMGDALGEANRWDRKV